MLNTAVVMTTELILLAIAVIAGLTLTRAFGPHDDYLGDIRRYRLPLRIVAGNEDELFDASRYAITFTNAGRQVPVTVVPGVNHMGLTLDSRAMSAIIRAAGK